MKEQLFESVKEVLADTFAFYLKAHMFHWNVEGPDFPQYHAFLGDLYEEVHGSVDGIAEQLRTLGQYAPGSFSRFSELSSIKDNRGTPSATEMVMELYSDNETVLSALKKAYLLAEQYEEFGVSNFLQDRYQAHKKHSWMLLSILKRKE